MPSANEEAAAGAAELLRAQSRIFNDSLSHAGAMSLKCALELNIPDIIHSHGQPISFADLVSKLDIPLTNSPAIFRVMRLLTHQGYFSYEKDSDSYSLTSLSKLLVSDHPTTLTNWFLGVKDENFLSPWHMLALFCRLDHRKHYTTLFELRHGKPLFGLTNEMSEFCELFNMIIAGDTKVTASAMVSLCAEAFAGLTSLVDVGGGDGTTAKLIAEAFPHVKYTLFDLPHVIDALPEIPGVEAVGGDMFKDIPSADAVFMKLILHDWCDEDCVRILKRCKEAISSAEGRGKVIIVDIVLDHNNQDAKTTETQLFWDLTMLIMTEGKERDEHEWKKIFEDAGFTSYKITPLGVRSLIEVFP